MHQRRLDLLKEVFVDFLESVYGLSKDADMDDGDSVMFMSLISQAENAEDFEYDAKAFIEQLVKDNSEEA